MAREIFGPLGAVVEIGAVSATGTWSVGTASVGELVHRRRGEVDRLLELVRGVGGFSSSTMAIADELGCLREHEVTAPSLLLWSGAIEGIPSRLDELERPDVVRRMCHMAADLQLTYFLQALVTAAVAAETEVRQGAGRITEALAIAAGLAPGRGLVGVAPGVRGADAQVEGDGRHGCEESDGE